MVVVILAIAAGILLQRGPPRSATLDLRAAASELGRTLRAARVQAITADRPVVVKFDIPGHAYAADGQPLHRLPLAFALTLVAVSPNAAAGATTIAFTPDGSSSGGHVTMAQGGRRIAVDVGWLTGRVAVSPIQVADVR